MRRLLLALGLVIGAWGQQPDWVQNVRNKPFIDVREYGVKCNGKTDDTAAFQKALDLGVSRTIVIPHTPGSSCLITDTLNIKYNGVKLVGQGQRSTFLTFTPTVVDKPAIKIQSEDASQIVQNKVSGMSITGSGTYRKLGVNVIDAGELELSDLALNTIHDAANGSTGIRIAGRQTINIHDVLVEADKPMVIGENPNHAYLDSDHMHVWNWYSIATGNYHLTVEDGASVFNMTWDGYQAWAGGTGGVYWVTPSTVYASLGITFKNVRTEQFSTTGAYTFYLAPSSMQNLLIDNAYCGVTVANTSHYGFYLRNIVNGILQRSVYSGQAPLGGNYVALNADGTADVVLLGNLWQVGSTTTLIGFTGFEIAIDGTTTWHTSTVDIGDNAKVLNLRAAGVNIGHSSPSSHFLTIPNGASYGGINVGGTDSVSIAAISNTDKVVLAPGGADVKLGTGSTLQLGEDATNAPIAALNSATSTENAAAPGVVPGCSADLTIGIDAAVGDVAWAAPPVTLPSGFSLTAWVSASNAVSIRWCQFSGAPADPDGAGGTYRVSVVRH